VREFVKGNGQVNLGIDTNYIRDLIRGGLLYQNTIQVSAVESGTIVSLL